MDDPEWRTLSPNGGAHCPVPGNRTCWLMKWYVGKGVTVGFGLAVAVLVIAYLVMNSNLTRIDHNGGQVLHSNAILDELDAVLLALVDAETGQRGYLITGTESFLEPYERARVVLDGHLALLKKLAVDNPKQIEMASKLIEKARIRMTTIDSRIALVRKGEEEAAREAVRIGTGKVEMDEIRDLVRQMRETEEAQLAARALQTDLSHQAARFVNVVSALMGLAMVGTAYVMTARDISARQQTEAELERKVAERTGELQELNTALRTSNRELEQFASVASHDLQEPLRKIEAFGDRLKTRSTTLDDPGRDYLDRILDSASRMRKLINDLLSFSRVTTRAQPFTPVDLSRVASEVLSDLEARVQQVGGRVEIRGKLPTIDADPTQARQLLQNLIGNALKFHRPDAPPVVEVEGVVSNERPDRPRLVLTVKDNGIGFEEVYVDRIFEVFQRLHGRNEYEGTGIGLAICRKIAERHGGTITARSTPGQGATFIVTLPVRQNTEEPQNA